MQWNNILTVGQIQLFQFSKNFVTSVYNVNMDCYYYCLRVYVTLDLDAAWILLNNYLTAIYLLKSLLHHCRFSSNHVSICRYRKVCLHLYAGHRWLSLNNSFVKMTVRRKWTNMIYNCCTFCIFQLTIKGGSNFFEVLRAKSLIIL